MRATRLVDVCTSVLLLTGIPTPAPAQIVEPQTRATIIEEAQGRKASSLEPYVPSKTERLISNLEEMLVASSDT